VRAQHDAVRQLRHLDRPLLRLSRLPRDQHGNVRMSNDGWPRASHHSRSAKGIGFSTRGEASMSIKLTMALVAVIAYASLAQAGGDGNRDRFKSAQYCVPQYDNSDAVRVYC
jgi:hypothetical protein